MLFWINLGTPFPLDAVPQKPPLPPPTEIHQALDYLKLESRIAHFHAVRFLANLATGDLDEVLLAALQKALAHSSTEVPLALLASLGSMKTYPPIHTLILTAARATPSLGQTLAQALLGTLKPSGVAPFILGVCRTSLPSDLKRLCLIHLESGYIPELIDLMKRTEEPSVLVIITGHEEGAPRRDVRLLPALFDLSLRVKEPLYENQAFQLMRTDFPKTDVVAFALPRLTASQPAVRRKALRLLQGAPAPEEPLILHTLARDSDPGIRAEALACLGDYPSETSLQILLDALGDPDERILIPAALALGKRRPPQAGPPLYGLLKHSLSASLHWAVTDAIIGIDWPDRTAALLLGLEGSSIHLREQIVTALATLNDPSTWPVFERELFSPNYQTRTQALEALSRLNAPAALSLLFYLRDDPDALKRFNGKRDGGLAIDPFGGALDQVPISSAHLPLLKETALAPSRQVRTRLWAINALGALRNREAIPTLQQLLQDPREDIRRAAGQQLEIFGEIELRGFNKKEAPGP